MPRVSFIVPLYNCLPLTQAMLASLQATLPAALDHEIVFVDDGSTDGTREWLASLPSERIRVVLNERNLGYAAANNRAAKIARGELLLLLNNDLEFDPGWLEPMLAQHAALRARAGILGNVQRDARTGAIDHAGITINHQGKPVHVRRLPPPRLRTSEHLWVVPAVTGACLLLQRNLWEQLGGFDEAFVNGGEDIDLCFRARAAGRITAVALRSVIRHHVSSSAGRKRRDEQNSYLLARRWGREFLTVGDHAVRSWCQEYVSHAFAWPRALEYETTLRALSYLLGLRDEPPPQAHAGVATNLDHEFARWRQMFPQER